MRNELANVTSFQNDTNKNLQKLTTEQKDSNNNISKMLIIIHH